MLKIIEINKIIGYTLKYDNKIEIRECLIEIDEKIKFKTKLIVIPDINVNNQYISCISHVWEKEKYKHELVQWDVERGVKWKLKAIIRLARDQYIKYWWMDTLCINQNDNDEKIYQINNMNNIYKNSDRTVVLIKDIYTKNIINIKKIIINIWDDYEINKNENWLNSINTKKLYINLLKNFREICNDKWFSRVWTVQEALLPKLILFATIHEILSFKILSQLPGILGALYFYGKNVLEGNTNPFSNAVLHRMLGEKRRIEKFADVANLYRLRKATKEEDYAYGMLGFFQNVTKDIHYGIGKEKAMKWLYIKLLNSGDVSVLEYIGKRQFSNSWNFVPPTNTNEWWLDDRGTENISSLKNINVTEDGIMYCTGYKIPIIINKNLTIEKHHINIFIQRIIKICNNKLDQAILVWDAICSTIVIDKSLIIELAKWTISYKTYWKGEETIKKDLINSFVSFENSKTICVNIEQILNEITNNLYYSDIIIGNSKNKCNIMLIYTNINILKKIDNTKIYYIPTRKSELNKINIGIFIVGESKYYCIGAGHSTYFNFEDKEEKLIIL